MKPKRITKKQFLEMEEAFKAVTSIKKKEDVIPDGWWTVRNYASKFNLSESYASKHINILLKKGMLEKRDFKVNLGVIIRKTPHYRMKS